MSKTRAMPAWIATVLSMLVILGVDAGVAYLVGIDGEFPLGDDWAYAWPVRSLCERGEIDFLPWTGASVVAQVGYGTVLCRYFGFSFEVLRASTLALGTAADLGVLVLARLLGASTPIALLAALAFALSPLRVNLGFTFMTDLPFTALAVWSAVFYASGLRGRNTAAILLGSVLAATALLVRQHGIFLAIAAALAALPKRDPDHGVELLAKDPQEVIKAKQKLRKRLGLATRIEVAPAAEPAPAAPPPRKIRLGRRLSLALACLALPLATLVFYYLWLVAGPGIPLAVTRKAAEATQLGALTFANLLFRALEYLGLLLLPLVAAAWALTLRMVPLRTLAALAMLGGGALFLRAREGVLMPYLPNLIHDFGLGALTLRDTLFLGFPAPTASGDLFGLPLTVIATVGAALALALWSAGTRALRAAEADFLALALLLLLAGSLLHVGYYFDRYLLPLLPFALVFTTVGIGELQERRRQRLERKLAEGPVYRLRPGVAAALALLVTGWFSLAGTHDYMAWNRARHALLEQLIATGVTPDRIDGGMEFNAWYLAKASGHAPSDAEVKIGRDHADKSWWWVIDDEYVISMRELPGYEIYAQRRYSGWLVPGYASVYALERMRSASTRPLAPAPPDGDPE